MCAVADNSVLFENFIQQHIFLNQPVFFLQRFLDGDKQAFGFDGFFQKIIGPEMDGFHGNGKGAFTRNHNHRQQRKGFGNTFKHIQTVCARHGYVQKHAIEIMFA